MFVRHEGFSFLEILITISIITIGLLGITLLLISSHREIQESVSRSHAVWLLDDLSNRMLANREAIKSYHTQGIYQCPSQPPVFCESRYDTSKHLAQNCSADDMASYDLWDVACPTEVFIEQLKVRRSAADVVDQLSLTINVDDVQAVAEIELVWGLGGDINSLSRVVQL